MKHLSICLILILISASIYSQQEKIHEDWIKMDSIFINQIKKAYISDKLSIERILKPNKAERTNLGYDYSMISAGNGKGYVSIKYVLIYKNGKLISYYLNPEMPDESEIYQRYIEFYKGMFTIKENKPLELYYKYNEVSKPIKDLNYTYTDDLLIQHYMTPYSGIMYGYFGGIANTILTNRKEFNSIKILISEKVLVQLLNSINPASRFCAAEFYLENKSLFSQRELIESLIEENFKEMPVIETLSGCIVTEENSRDLVNKYKDIKN